MVLKEGLEPSRLATVVFETTASAIPPFEYSMYQGARVPSDARCFRERDGSKE